MKNNLRVIWEEGDGLKSKALGGVDTTFSNVKQVLKDSGRSFNDFNALISGAKVVTGRSVDCILWCSGSEVEGLFQGLRSKGLCSDICKA